MPNAIRFYKSICFEFHKVSTIAQGLPIDMKEDIVDLGFVIELYRISTKGSKVIFFAYLMFPICDVILHFILSTNLNFMNLTEFPIFRKDVFLVWI